MLSETLRQSQQCLIILPYWAENCKCFFQFFLLLPKDCPAEKENRPALRSACCPAGQTAGKPRQRLQPPAVKALLPGRQPQKQSLQQLKVVFGKKQQTLVPQAAKLLRKAAAVNTQIIRQLLA